MPASALALALGAAVLHAVWNLLLARARDVEAAMGELGGRPHWGKRSFLTAAELAPRYPAWDAFQAYRRELDPEGRFANAWLKNVLG